MIAYLEGTLLHADLDSCVVLTPAGVGYHLFLTARGLSGLSAQGEAVRFCLYCGARRRPYLVWVFFLGGTPDLCHVAGCAQIRAQNSSVHAGLLYTCRTGHVHCH